MRILIVENSPNVARSFSYLSEQADIAVVKPYRYEKYPAPKEFDAIIVTGGRDSIEDDKSAHSQTVWAASHSRSRT